MLEFNYKKINNDDLFKSLEKLDIKNTQNYIPLYNNFFNLSLQNYNKINLNQQLNIESVENKIEKNKYICKLKNKNRLVEKQSFFKFSPLLDPIKFMCGKYQKMNLDDLQALPKFENNICNKKLLNVNNTAYIDSFFSFLSSKVLYTHKAFNCIDFYGSFLAIKGNFSVNIFDDLEYLTESSYFTENCNKLFKLENIDDLICNNSTRNNMKKINISNSKNIILNLDEISCLDFDKVFEKCVTSNRDISTNCVYEHSYGQNKLKKRSVKSKKSSECSSNSSHTSHENSENEDEFDDESESGSECSYSSDDEEEENVEAIIYNFPVQIIALENMDNTLDSRLNKDLEMNDHEWRSCLFQIIITLIMYQHMFDFTHNDLHTNNIMFKKTDKQYLYYKYDNVHYKVPTHGRIWKIIDFGRAIYKFKGKRMCSDSFSKSGDAATQYNCEPFFNKNKPRLEPNKSFDLCRLACSLFDYFIDDLKEQNTPVGPVEALVVKWCTDDKNRNILYKTNGDERYPDFKLYKMIARTVHNHKPQTEIKNPLFNKFITSKKKIKKAKILNIDNLPTYSNTQIKNQEHQ